ncbi:MAG TPA: PadR family transcriptional regulator [Microthrixaceae bacterium]|nr:PadR family transcriptional regulator [Microthrixaceae bacterium]
MRPSSHHIHDDHHDLDNHHDPFGRRVGRGRPIRGSGRGRGRGGYRSRSGGRANRGDVRAAVLALLAEQPMHGYQIISELDERTGGAWKPSPGSVYPTLQMLADEGLVRSEPEGGKNVFHLTDSGRRAAAEGDSAPWDAVAGDGATVDVRRTIAQLAMAFKQVTHTGTVDQVERATRILNDARKAIYGILAEDPSETRSS